MEQKPTPQIYGLIGYPVKHSLSPAMHNAAFKKLGIPAEYRLFEVRPQDLEDFLLKDISANDTDGSTIPTKDIKGFNITIPHKVRAREILEKRFPLAPTGDLFYRVKVSGAINTVKRSPNGLEYYWNTDVLGFSQSLREDLKFRGKDINVLLIGCGGAGRGVIAVLSWESIYHTKKIYIYEKDVQAANAAQRYFFQELSPGFSFLKEKLEFISSEQIAGVIKKCQLLVNTSPLGMKDSDPSPIDKSLLRRDLYVYDVVYNRNQKTQLIRDAESLGISAQDGLGMLVRQGAISFELWTGKEAPLEAMRQALAKELQKR